MQKRGAKVIKSFELASEAREKTFIPIFAVKSKRQIFVCDWQNPRKKEIKRKSSATIKDF